MNLARAKALELAVMATKDGGASFEDVVKLADAFLLYINFKPAEAEAATPAVSDGAI